MNHHDLVKGFQKKCFYYSIVDYKIQFYHLFLYQHYQKYLQKLHYYFEQQLQNYYLHLYNPQITSPGSVMAPFSYLFEEMNGEVSDHPNALVFPEESPYAPDEGTIIIPTRRAIALVEYLLSLKFDYNLPEAIISKNGQAK